MDKFSAHLRHIISGKVQEAKLILEEFKRWLEEASPTVLPQSPLGKAIRYCLKLSPGLTRYLEDGRLEIDNNLTEQQIKPFVIIRKNFLFANSVDGANVLCLHLSLIRTAKLHGLDPYHYRESWSVDYPIFDGDPAKSSTWQHLSSLMSTLFPSEDGLDRGISMMAIDAGYATQEVYGWIWKYCN